MAGLNVIFFMTRSLVVTPRAETLVPPPRRWAHQFQPWLKVWM